MSNPLVSESPDEVILGQAARAALLAEVQHIRATRKIAFDLPAEDQVVRLIAAAWPVLAASGAGETSG